ncbi:acetyl-CoA carboxylase biotin carboxylase subunit [Metabacillus indicus]|uniref:acetyl-CoA carboxylase biotin carboxylase subunit n=1 Tax=Metabacillus indicus TaxID=246786 RepID=UPI003CF04E6A
MKKILIANRGEIALRIMKTCQKMGVETVAVYSDADEGLPFVKAADYAFRIGEAPVAKSYLLKDDILNIAVREKVDAIHPGYGFLSENTEFAQAAEAKGIKFIGPKSETLAIMGDKVAARKTMKEAGVPVVPGSSGLADMDEACAYASEIGYPVMLKASGGGGGIGMQRCDDEAALKKSFASVKTRAKAYFGNDDVFIEKFISEARHIEIQLFGDEFGNVVHMFERDCSVQRRNQKVVEESPSPHLSEATREKMCAAAVAAAIHAGYINAGTIEFIVDEEENFYFLEMNTRLQVEHRVTEGITGLDLVEWQIRTAAGEKLPFMQPEITKEGHSIQFRLYAEDPVKFIPSPGLIKAFTFEEMDGVIVDCAYAEGDTVTPFYDPLVAKIIVTGENRPDALAKAEAFLNGVKIEGIKTNLPLFLTILSNSQFKKGTYSTSFLQTAVLA